jgi:PncC family amidohydrolase
MAQADLSELLDALKEARAMLCCVESCTGGGIAARLTDLSGSSEVFWGSWVTYANEAKERLGVPRALLIQHGAVSEPVARAMAETGLGVLRSEGSTKPHAHSALLCVSTTGVAGPLGGTAEKPVGLCWIAVAYSLNDGSRKTIARRLQSPLGSDRLQNREYFIREAASLIREILSSI